MKRSWRILSACSLVLLFAEGVLRWRGYHALPVFIADARYEYMTAPNQRIETGGIRFVTNEIGMRCGSIGTKKKKRVLVVGDSVINGGLSSTQDSLATAIAERLSDAEVLNCSAPSWGPDNAAAFLAVHGPFEADHLIAVFSSHDAFDRMTFEPLVGVHPAYPDRTPLFALQAYAKKISYRPNTPADGAEGRVFNDGWLDLLHLASAQGIPFTVLLHAETSELAAGQYDARGQQLLDSLHAWHVPVIDLLSRMDSAGYWDQIHLNDRGQHALGDALSNAIRTTVTN